MFASALVSGGKDSIYSSYLAETQGLPIDELVVVAPSDPDSMLFHTPNLGMVELQARAWGKRYRRVEVEGSGPEAEAMALRAAIAAGGNWVVAGAIGSSFQWAQLHRSAFELGRKVYTPLWGKAPRRVVEAEIDAGLDIRLVHLAAEGLTPELLGSRLDRPLLAEIARRSARGPTLHLAGEGGEFESLVVDAPFFEQRIEWERAEALATQGASTLRLHGGRLVPKRSHEPPR